MPSPSRHRRTPGYAPALLAVFLLNAALCAPALADEPARFSIRKGDKFGAIDATGRIVIPPQYDTELRFSDGLARVVVGSKTGFVDTAGKLVISPQAKISIGSGDFAQEVSLPSLITGEFSEGLAPFRLEHKFGYVDKTGAVAIPPQFEEAEAFKDGRALVVVNGHYGSINRSGKFLIEPTLDRPYRFQEGLAAVVTPGKGFGYMDTQGRTVIEPQFNYAYNFAGGRARAQVKGGYGYIDKQGKVAISPSEQFKISADFSDGRAPVRVADKGWGYLDDSGNLVIEPQFFSATAFSEGLAAVAVGDFRQHPWGFIDTSGKLVVPAQYEQVEAFSEGFAAVRLKGGYGYVDTKGKLAIGPLIDVTQIESFSNGLARVWYSQRADASGRWGYIDRKGKLVWRSD